MKYIIILFLTFCTGISLYAQSNYKQGYVITNENDTINGLIDFRTDRANSNVCKFKKSEKSDEQVFHPGEILGYRFIKEMKYYVSRTVEIDKIKQTVFLEYLVQGIKDLYFYSGDKNYYFIENEDGSLLSVTQEPDKIIDDKIKVDYKYKGALAYIFRDCKSVYKKIDKATLDRSSMIKLTRQYHSEMCSPGEECIVFENDYKKVFLKLDFSLFGGFQYMDYLYENTELIRFGSAKSFSPIVGGVINVSNPRITESISLQAGISLSSIKGSNEYTFEQKNYEKFNFDALMTSGNLGLKFTYPRWKLRPSIEANINYCRLFNTSTTLYSEKYVVDKINKVTNNNYVSLLENYIGFSYGFGLNYQFKKENSIFCRLLYTQMSNNDGNIKGAQLKLGYEF